METRKTHGAEIVSSREWNSLVSLTLSYRLRRTADVEIGNDRRPGKQAVMRHAICSDAVNKIQGTCVPRADEVVGWPRVSGVTDTAAGGGVMAVEERW